MSTTAPRPYSLRRLLPAGFQPVVMLRASLRGPWQPPWQRRMLAGWPAGLLIASLAITLITAALYPFSLPLGQVNIGLVYLLLSVLCAALWGWGPGLYAAVVSNLTFNYYFVPP